MTVVYIDSLFLLNLIINYLLLLATAKVAGEPISRPRLGGGAAVGALYAAANFFPGMGFLSHPAIKVCAGVVMALLAFGGRKRLLRLTLIFFGLSCAFGGGVLAVGLLGGTGLTFQNGIPATGMDLKVVLLSAAGCYVLLTLVFRRMGRHSRESGEVVDVTLELDGRRVSFAALLDTGNTLTDPVSDRPVLVAEWTTLWPLLPAGMELSADRLRHPAQVLEELPAPLRSRFRLLPYRAVGVESGLLLALRTDWGRVGGARVDGLLVALSPGPVSDGGSYHGLVGTGIGEMCV